MINRDDLIHQKETLLREREKVSGQLLKITGALEVINHLISLWSEEVKHGSN